MAPRRGILAMRPLPVDAAVADLAVRGDRRAADNRAGEASQTAAGAVPKGRTGGRSGLHRAA